MRDCPSIIPYLRYAEPRIAMTFLTKAFGFEEMQVFEDEAGAHVHGEMRFGNGVVFIGAGEGEKGAAGVYLVVEDVDEHHQRASEAGAEIVEPPADTPFGTRRYRARDIEGYEWSFGTYMPSSDPSAWS